MVKQGLNALISYLMALKPCLFFLQLSLLLFKGLLDKLGSFNEPLLKILKAAFLHKRSGGSVQLLWVAKLGQEWRKVVLLPQLSLELGLAGRLLLHFALLLGVGIALGVVERHLQMTVDEIEADIVKKSLYFDLQAGCSLLAGDFKGRQLF